MTCMETAFPSVDETCKNRVTIACTGVAAGRFFSGASLAATAVMRNVHQKRQDC